MNLCGKDHDSIGLAMLAREAGTIETPHAGLELVNAKAEPRPEGEKDRLARLNRVLDEVWASNLFYARKWRQAGVTVAPLASVADLDRFPLTTRSELIHDQASHPPLGQNLTCAAREWKHLHRSSGTTQAPLLWVDSVESWQWVLNFSRRLWQLSGVRPADRVMFLMPFGQSSGPWIMYEGAGRLGCARFHAGLTDLEEQLRWLECFRPTVLAGKPGILQRLAQAAQARGNSPTRAGVKKLIFTGERSASVRGSLEDSWGAECFDRYGTTEAGSVAAECTAHSGGLHLMEDAFLPECVDPKTGQPVEEGETGELVLTTLGRLARPIIRYRTGDLVRLVRDRPCPCGRRGAMLMGGVTRGI